VVEHPLRLGPVEGALAAGPVDVLALQRAAALGAAPGVFLPALPAGDPGDLGGRGGGPADQRVVAVGDDVGGLAGQRFAPLLGQQPDLGGPVHLVAAEVHQADDAGAGGVEHLGEVLLVDLQHAVGRVLVLGEGGDVAGGHVGAERVGGHLPQ